ncbi:DUF3304 domain-containing protein [Ralstonia mannitolilytica]|uniref:DUF3304 domain-containing protein n=1 Tax=Ralstonia mannitolilytica TaxID=105219 RepID=UPI000CEE31F9|nr:DUF3304 domain-containing protein [Ralstonia mannitolilytica]MBU9581117.1 DUF3304 domain-containing protein [Ralstonia mannitolilytica]
MKARTWAALLLALLALGCKPSQQAQAAPQDEDLGLQVQILNYTDEGLGVVYVNGVWAGSMRNHAGGTSVAGSVGLPAKWHPGLTVEVQWQDDTLYKQDHDALHKMQVSVEPYETGEPATLWLAFMPSNKIRAIASRYTPHNPKFPGGLKFPYDVCMADPACAARFYPQRVPIRSGNP